jgi:hypothetical protein
VQGEAEHAGSRPRAEERADFRIRNRGHSTTLANDRPVDLSPITT